MKILFCFFLLTITIFYACNKDDEIVNPKNIHYEKWVEEIIVDSTGRENPFGNIIIKNLLEFFDTTYKFTSSSIGLVDSSIVTVDSFYNYYVGAYKFRSDTLRLFTSDNKYLSVLKTIKKENFLWMGAISECWLTNDKPYYWCRQSSLGRYVDSFLWEKLSLKQTALFNRRL